MTDDIILKARAAELIQAGVSQAKTRKMCAGVIAVAFIAGLFVGLVLPWDVRIVHASAQVERHQDGGY